MPRKCGLCGKEGHDKRNCEFHPDRVETRERTLTQTIDRLVMTNYRLEHNIKNLEKEVKTLEKKNNKNPANEKNHKVVVKQFEVLFNIIDDNASNIPDQNYMDGMKALEALYDITKP